jgi:hypothetical protein
MAAKSLDERMKLLEETNEKQQRRIQRLEDICDIQNFFSRYVYLQTSGSGRELLDLCYAKKTPGVSAEIANWGRWEGMEALRKMMMPEKAQDPTKTPGHWYMHTLTTPVIEVAGDGKTAKGVWTSPGHETGTDSATGNLRAYWCWTKYGVDFVKENGKWKIWHYHVYRIFLTPYEMSWVDEYERKIKRTISAAGPQPNKPSTYDHPYAIDNTLENVPTPPDPYETFDPKTSY